MDIIKKGYMSKSLYIIYAFISFAMHVIIMVCLNCDDTFFNIFSIGILFMFITLITLIIFLPYNLWISLDFLRLKLFLECILKAIDWFNSNVLVYILRYVFVHFIHLDCDHIVTFPNYGALRFGLWYCWKDSVQDYFLQFLI